MSALGELQERFDRFIDIYDEIDFFRSLNDYFLFIKETSPFNTITRGILEDNSISGNYVLKEIWERELKLPEYPGITKEIVRPFLRSFHNKLLDEAKRHGLEKKEVIILDRSESHIYLKSEPAKCYAMKGEDPQRFRIVLSLRDGKPKTARMLSRQFFNDESREKQNYIKQQIEEINRLFRKWVADVDLITHEQRSGRNTYQLNSLFLYREDK